MKILDLLENLGMDRLQDDHPFYGKEAVGEFLKRRGVNISPNGKFILYYAHPRGRNNRIIRAGTYLETDSERAKFIVARERGLNPNKDIDLFALTLEPNDIEIGDHITLTRDFAI